MRQGRRTQDAGRRGKKISVSRLLNVNGVSLIDSLLQRSNYLVSLSLGSGENRLNYEDTHSSGVLGVGVSQD